jgi:transposase InsO family protein
MVVEEGSTMPWKETCAMEQRFAFIAEYQHGDRTLSELCAVFGVSRKTGYKWLDRYAVSGPAGLQEVSRAAKHHPNAVAAAQVQVILELRRQHPLWGPLKLRDWLQLQVEQEHWPAASTIGEVLLRAGLVRHRARPKAWVFGRPRLRADAANALWSADFKGHFRTGDGRCCYPLTISDNYSRYLLHCQALTRPCYGTVRPWFERVFRQYGLPTAIRTDNGAPFGAKGLAGLSRLSVWWLKLGIVPEHIQPGHPEQNPRHERMHATLKRAACRPRSNVREQQVAFTRFVSEFNDERPHQALHGRTPAMLYTPSPRRYPKVIAGFEYPDGFTIRRVLPSGDMWWMNRRMRATEALIGEDVGLRCVDDGVWLLYAGPLVVGRIDARRNHIDRIEPYIDLEHRV